MRSLEPKVVARCTACEWRLGPIEEIRITGGSLLWLHMREAHPDNPQVLFAVRRRPRLRPVHHEGRGLE